MRVVVFILLLLLVLLLVPPPLQPSRTRGSRRRMVGFEHLVIETSKANLVDGMKWLLGTYTGRFNRRHKLLGHLFSGRSAKYSGTDEPKKWVRTFWPLKRLRWTEEQLRRHRKGDPAKGQMALRLRQQTTMTLSWIAEQLHMGTKTHLEHLLYWQRREQGPNLIARY